MAKFNIFTEYNDDKKLIDTSSTTSGSTGKFSIFTDFNKPDFIKKSTQAQQAPTPTQQIEQKKLTFGEKVKGFFSKAKTFIGENIFSKKEEEVKEPPKGRLLEFLSGVASGGVLPPGLERDDVFVKDILVGTSSLAASGIDVTTGLFETFENKKFPNLPEDQKTSTRTRKVSKKIKKWSAEMSPENPDFADQIMQGVGSMGAFIAASYATGGGAIIPVVLESLSEGGTVYEENRDAGVSIEESGANATKTLGLNLILNTVLNVFDINSKDIGAIAKVIKGTGTEGIQEGAQQIISNVFTKRPLMEGVLESLGVGAVLGGGTTIIISSGDSGKDKQFTKREGETEFKTSNIVIKESKVIGEFDVAVAKGDVTINRKREVIKIEKRPKEVTSAIATIRPDGTAGMVVEIDPKAQSKGIGADIVNQLEVKLIKKDVSKALITAREKSIGFWEKQGYKAVEGEKVKDGFLKMQKTLTGAPAVQPKKPTDLKIKPKKSTQGKLYDAKQIRNQVDKVLRLGGDELKDISIVGSTAKGKVKPNDLDIIISTKKGVTQAVPSTELRSRQQLEKVFRDELQPFFPDKKLHINIGEVDPKRGASISLDEFRKQALIRERGKYPQGSKKWQGFTDEINKLNAAQQPIGDATKKAKAPVKVKEVRVVKEESVKNVKNIKDVKNTLKAVRKNFEDLTLEVEGQSIVAQEQREGLNIKDINLLKRIVARSKKFREGDIETIRASNTGALLNRVIENIQEKNPEMSESEAFNFALDLPTKATAQQRTTAETRELAKKEKTLRKLLDDLKAKQKELDIKQDDVLFKQWQSVLDAQEKLIKLIEVPQRQLPVGEGKEKVSRLQARLKGALENTSREDIEELGLTTFRQMNQIDQIKKATEFVINNTEEAMKVVRGEIDPPKGILQNSVFAALVELGKVDTDVATKVATLTATRFGQEINILKKILADNPVVMMQDIVEARIEAYEKKSGKKISTRIKSENKSIDKKIRPTTTEQWNSFIEEIRC